MSHGKFGLIPTDIEWSAFRIIIPLFVDNLQMCQAVQKIYGFLSLCDPDILILLCQEYGAHSGAVVEALRYKPEGRGIDSRWCIGVFQ
jgi:hypothetical protein